MFASVYVCLRVCVCFRFFLPCFSPGMMVSTSDLPFLMAVLSLSLGFSPVTAKFENMTRYVGYVPYSSSPIYSVVFFFSFTFSSCLVLTLLMVPELFVLELILLPVVKCFRYWCAKERRLTQEVTARGNVCQDNRMQSLNCWSPNVQCFYVKKNVILDFFEQ